MTLRTIGHSALGQITFAIEQDADQSFSNWIWIHARRHDTCRNIAARRGRPEEGATIAQVNHIRSEWFKFKKPRRLRVPGTMKQGEHFSVLSDDAPPQIVDGYAVLQQVGVVGRIGIAQFTGYNPVAMQLNIRFLSTNTNNGTQVEKDIALLEKMAGRGNFTGAGIGPPPVVRISTTNNQGFITSLIPSNYQWSDKNTHAPLWRIQAITWDPNPTRDEGFRRVDQKAQVVVWQYTPLIFAIANRSATHRAKKRAKHTTHKKRAQ